MLNRPPPGQSHRKGDVTPTRRRVIGAVLTVVILVGHARPVRADTVPDPAAWLGGVNPFNPTVTMGAATDQNVPTIMDGSPFLGDGNPFQFAVVATPSPSPPAAVIEAPRADPAANAPPPTFTGNLNGNAQPVRGGLGFYPGDGAEPIELHQFEGLPALYGVRPNTVVLMEDTGSPSRMNGSTWGHFLQPGAWQTANPKPTMVISVPLAFGSFTPDAATSQRRLEEVASGQDDDAYLYLAQALRGAGYPAAVIRLGWEFDGNWMPWEATHWPDLYVAAYRHIVLLMRTISSGFRFDLTGAAGVPFNGELAYPGDAYVDIVGMDIYDEPGVNVAAQLAPRAAFAAAHGKQVSYAEWGLTSARGDDPGFISAMASWFSAMGPRLAYQSYFLGLAVGSPLTQHPQARATYTRLFS